MSFSQKFNALFSFIEIGFGCSPAIALVKIKIIQELIQIERPKIWNEEKMDSLVEELVRSKQTISCKIYIQMETKILIT
jgi:hypothetical protein